MCGARRENANLGGGLVAGGPDAQQRPALIRDLIQPGEDEDVAKAAETVQRGHELVAEDKLGMLLRPDPAAGVGDVVADDRDSG